MDKIFYKYTGINFNKAPFCKKKSDMNQFIVGSKICVKILFLFLLLIFCLGSCNNWALHLPAVYQMQYFTRYK